VAQALATAISGSGAGLTATPGTSGAITITANQTGTTDNGLTVTLSSATNQPKFFSSASFSGTSGTLSGGVEGSTAGPLYQYTIPASGAPLGYDAHGNLLSYSDCVNNNCATSDCLNNFCGAGIWSANYDNLNRVSGASASAGPWSGLGMGWTYDSFGNRKTQTLSGTPPTGVPQSQTLNYPSQNRISNFGSSGYDAAGNITYDLINQYAYDAEGRVCAVAYHSGMTTAYMVYIYDADGRRVAKGSNPTFSCTPATTGFAMQETYLLGQSGEHVTELDGSGAFLRSHVYADGHLLATYENNTTQFAFNDWLGSKRLVAGPLGQVTGSCVNLPFGDDLTCNSNVPLDGHHFTGQIHDKETGNDYFGARYFSNYTGRFLSPDWSEGVQPIPYADPANPQSLNLYAYVNNNPLINTDQDGHSCDQGSVGPDGVLTFKCQNDPTLLDDFVQEFRTDPNQQRTLIAQKGLTLPNGHPLDAGVLNGMSDNAVNSLAHQLAAQQYAQIMSALTSIPFKSSWGWNNSPAYIKARNELKAPGDHPDLNGKVPTRQEANQMIQEAGGSVDRNDPGHAPGGVSTHTDPHVNYTTPSGQKATVTVREQ
jgi:RHS repeat-associated protein